MKTYFNTQKYKNDIRFTKKKLLYEVIKIKTLSFAPAKFKK